MHKDLLFGTGGIPDSAVVKTTVGGIKRVSELGLDCMEVEFVHGVKMSEKSAAEVHDAAHQSGIELTAHGPYAINLNSEDPDKLRSSIERILTSARISGICGAQSVVFHAAFYGAGDHAAVYAIVKRCLQDVISELRREGNGIAIRPEIMGKGSQFGTLEEVLRLSSEVSGIAPAIDFAHWHARTGRYNSYEEFAEILQQMQSTLGKEALGEIHAHVSGIVYGKLGEIKHVNLAESDFQYKDLLRAFKDFSVRGFVICESPDRDREGDALLMKRTFQAL